VSWNPSAEEIADRYSDAHARVVALVDGLPDEQAATNVPGTPRWTVRELVSHLVGGPCELMAGNFTDAGSDEWTQAQVDARRGRTVADLLEEWDSVLPSLDGASRAGHVPAPVSFDVITHEQDLRGALGAEPTPDQLAIRFVTGGFAARVDRVVADAGLPPLEIRDPAAGWSVGSPGGICFEASEFEVFRALTGRRSGRQVSASPFGPLRETDVSD
jgi:uncharacterized protein (TIGR03083 family)